MPSPSAVVAHVLRTLFGGDSSAAAGSASNLRSFLTGALRSVTAPLSHSTTELLGGDPARLTRGLDLRLPLGLRASARARFAAFERPERLVPLAVCGLLVGAALLSSIPAVGPASAAGAPSRPPRIVIAALDARGAQATSGAESANLTAGDGSVSNTLSDPNVGAGERSIITAYTVANGDSLHSIASRFGLTTTTVYWANKSKLPDPASIRAGLSLLIPSFDGVIVVAQAGDTLESFGAKYEVAVSDLVDFNNLMAPALAVGQRLVIPGVTGGPMPLPPVAVKIATGAGTATKTATKTGTKTGTGTTCRSCGPTTYRGGSFAWPVGGHNYVSQYFWRGHHAVDIAAPYGTAVLAAAGGTVVYAGWRSYSQGGNVIWISHGSGIYTTYNHLSAWQVRAGQRVSAGQRIGSIGTSGMATGPHLHFEVWTAYPWSSGSDSAAINPCRYLSAC